MIDAELIHKVETMLYMIENEGVDYYFSEYASPDTFDFDTDLKKAAIAFVEARIRLMAKLNDLSNEYDMGFELE